MNHSDQHHSSTMTSKKMHLPTPTPMTQLWLANFVAVFTQFKKYLSEKLMCVVKTSLVSDYHNLIVAGSFVSLRCLSNSLGAEKKLPRKSQATD